MNYIAHLTAVMDKIEKDRRLHSSHVALYLALFQYWNINRFKNPISINRQDTLHLSKIGSRNTYHKCMRELSNWGFLLYFPSHDSNKGSIVEMYNFDTTSDTTSGTTNDTTNVLAVGQALVPSINNINKIKQTKQLKQKESKNNFTPPTLEEVLEFFKIQKFVLEEAEPFFLYYQANGWLVGKTKMKNWQAAAKNWILRSKKFQSEKAGKLAPHQLHAKPTNYEETL
jgi:hypothetical protein